MSLKDAVRRRINKKLEEHNEEPLSKSHVTDDDDLSDSKDRFSIAKYMRGALKGNWEHADLEKEAYVDLNKSTVSTVSGPQGGFLIPEETTDEILGRLRSEAVIRSLGATVYQIQGDTLKTRKMIDGASGNWVGKSEAGTEQSATDMFARDTLSLKKYIAVVSIDNDLLDSAAQAVDTIIMNDLTQEVRLAEDLAFLEGDGNKEPMGIYNDPDINQNVIDRDPTFDDLLGMIDNVEDANGSYSHFLMSPRAKNVFRSLKDGNGNYIWDEADPANGNPATLWGVPVALSGQISTTVDSSGNLTGGSYSYVILGNFPNFAIAQKQGQNMEMASSDVAEDAFTSDETWVRAKLKVDGMAKYAEEFEVLSAVHI